MTDIIKELRLKAPGDHILIGLSLHDWAFEMGRRHGWAESINTLDDILDPKTRPDDVLTPQDRISADEYARRSTSSG
jgi:hypothetical protein